MTVYQGGAWKRIARNEKFWRVVILGLILAFGLSYIVQVNAASTKGYQMRNFIDDNEVLRQENDRLAAEIDRLRSLSSIEEREVFLGLVKLQDVRYVSAGTSEVALKN